MKIVSAVVLALFLATGTARSETTFYDFSTDNVMKYCRTLWGHNDVLLGTCFAEHTKAMMRTVSLMVTISDAKVSEGIIQHCDQRIERIKSERYNWIAKESCLTSQMTKAGTWD